MIVDPVTRRYADALFELAREKGETDAVQRDVERIASELSAPGAARYLFDVRVEQKERRAKLRAVLGGLSPLTANFVELLFDKRRERVLEGLGPAWRRRALKERGAVEGYVESPRPLGAGEISSIASAMQRRLGREVLLDNRVVSGLVAGVRVVVENRMIDFSVRGRMDGLRRKLLEAPLPATGSA